MNLAGARAFHPAFTRGVRTLFLWLSVNKQNKQTMKKPNKPNNQTRKHNERIKTNYITKPTNKHSKQTIIQYSPFVSPLTKLFHSSRITKLSPPMFLHKLSPQMVFHPKQWFSPHSCPQTALTNLPAPQILP